MNKYRGPFPRPRGNRPDGASGGVFAVAGHLAKAVRGANIVLDQAEMRVGEPGWDRLVLRAGEVLRACSDTEIRLHDSILNITTMEQFHRSIIEIVEDESPAAAVRLKAQLHKLLTGYWATVQ